MRSFLVALHSTGAKVSFAKKLMQLSEPERVLYLAVPVAVHQAFFQQEFAQLPVERYQIKRLIYNPIQETIVQWI